MTLEEHWAYFIGVQMKGQAYARYRQKCLERAAELHWKDFAARVEAIIVKAEKKAKDGNMIE